MTAEIRDIDPLIEIARRGTIPLHVIRLLDAVPPEDRAAVLAECRTIMANVIAEHRRESFAVVK